MAVVWIPALLRPLTAGQARVTAAGATVQAVITDLEARYPGLQARLITEGRLRPELAVVVDGQTSSLRLRHPLTEASEVHFVLTISGGA